MIWTWLHRHPRLVDLGLAAATFAVGAAAATRHAHPVAGIVLGALASLVLLWRRRRPAEVVAAAAAATIATIASGAWPVPFQLAIAVFSLGAAQAAYARRVAAAAVAATVATLLVAGQELGTTAFHALFLAAAWFLGDSVGSRRAYVREIEEKAARLERERESEARRAVAEEQARIARELHDIVAHALSVIVVQAGAADDVFERAPGRARAAIRAIDAAARNALADLRRVLGTLQEEVEYRPQPGLAALDGLIEQVRATGLDVSLVMEGASRPLPAAVDLSAYRIVQEALTNTLKHAQATRASVRVRYGDELELEIDDDGRGAVNGAGGGNGLIGMRERAALLGGTLEARGATGGGFRVVARIPV